MRPDDFQAITGLCAPIMEKLDRYLACLRHWQRRINLVSSSTLADPWRRHVLDSLQIASEVLSPSKRLVDLGSGAGFPGMVLAITGFSDVHLIESDARKCAFLHQINAETDTHAIVVHNRIDKVKPFRADVVTARALAPLDSLIECAQPFLGSDSICLFLKGSKVEQELTAAQKKWNMRVLRVPSLTDPAGTVLKIERTGRRDNG